MIKEAIGFGTTIEEAKENAITELGAGFDDDVQFEVLSTPKKKTLGIFGGAKAEVRAFIELPDPKPVKPKSTKNKKNNRVKTVQTAPAAESEAKQHNVDKTEETSNDSSENAVDSSLIDQATPAGNAVKYLKKILALLGCENIAIKVELRENGAAFYLSGDGLGVVIGHRGENLDALQYLTSLSANSSAGYYKITLNIGNYREKRERTLTALAKRMSAQVLRTGRSRTLEPMNPYERRIIHTAVQEIDGVTSISVGEGSGRRVVISAQRTNGDNTKRPRKETNTAAVIEREPKKDTEIPLYGKIN